MLCCEPDDADHPTEPSSSVPANVATPEDMPIVEADVRVVAPALQPIERAEPEATKDARDFSGCWLTTEPSKGAPVVAMRCVCCGGRLLCSFEACCVPPFLCCTLYLSHGNVFMQMNLGGGSAKQQRMSRRSGGVDTVAQEVPLCEGYCCPRQYHWRPLCCRGALACC